MKIIYFVRHAKSSWKDDSLNDHDRPLNKRGKRDAPLMANVLKARGLMPDLLLSSTAVRALSTAQVFSEELGNPDLVLRLEANLYHASTARIESIVRQLPDEVNTVAIFGHNPGLGLVAQQMQLSSIDHFPTCGILTSCSKVDSWKSWAIAQSRKTAFWYPKQF